jgi:hypothetical protein
MYILQTALKRNVLIIGFRKVERDLREKAGRKAAITQATEGIGSVWCNLPDSVCSDRVKLTLAAADGLCSRRSWP